MGEYIPGITLAHQVNETILQHPQTKWCIFIQCRDGYIMLNRVMLVRVESQL